MALEFTYNKNAVGKAKLFCTSNLSMIKFVFTQLDDCHKQRFQSSCFKNLQKLRSTHVGYQLFHQLFMRQVQTGKTNEVWFKFKDKISRFGLQEFTLITGLNAGDLEEEVVEGKTVPRLLKNYFSNQKIDREDLNKAFCKCNDPEDKYKLGLLVCLVSVLLGNAQGTLLNPWLFFIVEDVDKFNNYPWGKKSFLYTIKNFKRKLKISSNKSTQKELRYNLLGFPLAVMIWGLEAIPSLGKRFVDSIGERVPRMLSWKLNDRILSSTMDKFLESEEYNVIRKMEPTEVEKAETFWQELTHLDDKEDSRVDDKDDFEDDDESVSGDIGNDAVDGEYDSLSNLFTWEDEDVVVASIINNRESPQSVPAQVNVMSQGRHKLCKRPAPQLAPEQNKEAGLASETTPSSSCHSIFDASDGELLPDKTYEAKLDYIALCQAKAAAALNELMPEFRSRPPSSVLSELENLKCETATARSKEDELEVIISRLRHENTELSSRCASLVAEEKNTREELTISRSREKELDSIISRLRNEITELSSEDKKTKEGPMVSRSKEKELEATNSRLTHENKTFSAQCAAFEAEYKRTIQELTVARRKEKEQEAAISRLTHKNNVFSAESSSYESKNIALEAENKKMKIELANSDTKLYSGARAAGYAEGVKDGKSKWLTSTEFLHHLIDASVKFFDDGFDSCQKQAEQQGFIGKLDKNSALNEALNSKDLEVIPYISK